MESIIGIVSGNKNQHEALVKSIASGYDRGKNLRQDVMFPKNPGPLKTTNISKWQVTCSPISSTWGVMSSERLSTCFAHIVFLFLLPAAHLFLLPAEPSWNPRSSCLWRCVCRSERWRYVAAYAISSVYPRVLCDVWQLLTRCERNKTSLLRLLQWHLRRTAGSTMARHASGFVSAPVFRAFALFSCEGNTYSSG